MTCAPSSVGAGRRFLHASLDPHLPGATVDTAVLLASEAMTNAVLHAGTPLHLDVYCDSGELVVEISDSDTRFPLHLATGPAPAALVDVDADAVGGRGLLLIATLASRWGVTPAIQGKTVWFAIDLPHCW